MKWLTKLITTYELGTKYPSLLQSLSSTKELLEEVNTELELTEQELKITQEDNDKLELNIGYLNNELYNCQIALENANNNVLKDYLYQRYTKRKIYRHNKVSVRDFCSRYNDKTPVVTGSSNDEIANNALKYVKNFLTYTSDKGENWQYANETLHRKKGDCEDGAILMYNIMVKSGVPVWRIRLNAGDVQGGGHAYVTYLREKNNDWYVLDWCYWYKESVNFRKTWKTAKKYFGIWFSFNNDYVWLNK